jgi:hypothetical protein
VIIVRFKGGLGNQLFQYAAGKALAVRHGVPLYCDLRWYGEDSSHGAKCTRTFDLSQFTVQTEGAAPDELRYCFSVDDRRLCARVGRRLPAWLLGRRIWIRDGSGYDPEFERLPANVFLDGYFQDPRYFGAIAIQLRDEFRLATPPPTIVMDLADELSSCNSVCIQVRRTDYVSNPTTSKVHGVCGQSYYREAWAQLIEKVPGARGYVFTDDQAWAEQTFIGWPHVTVIGENWDGPNYLHKFHLMCACRHFIIANSTWGWWAAWLGGNPDKIVVMPTEWYRDEQMKSAASGLRLPGWLCIN